MADQRAGTLTVTQGANAVGSVPVFLGESMFHYETDASKIAFVFAVQYLKNIGVKMIDCQMKTDHLLSFGAKEIVRNQFIQLLRTYIKT